jgi:hypothetical protein
MVTEPLKTIRTMDTNGEPNCIMLADLVQHHRVVEGRKTPIQARFRIVGPWRLPSVVEVSFQGAGGLGVCGVKWQRCGDGMANPNPKNEWWG